MPLARRLRDGGLRWEPAPGDRFVVADRNMDDEVFTVSEMTIEVHESPIGKVIGFNGTVEWALDSVTQPQTVWLPGEEQLRELLGGTFARLERDGAHWTVHLEVAGRTHGITHASARRGLRARAAVPGDRRRPCRAQLIPASASGFASTPASLRCSAVIGAGAAVSGS